MTARGLQPGLLTFGCMADAHTSPGPWRVPPLDAKCVRGRGSSGSRAPRFAAQEQKTLELILIHSHANSEVTRKGFTMAKRAKEIFSTYEEMNQRSVGLNTVTFNTMLDACAKCNAMHRASSLVEEMRQSAVELVIITDSTLLKGAVARVTLAVLCAWWMR